MKTQYGNKQESGDAQKTPAQLKQEDTIRRNLAQRKQEWRKQQLSQDRRSRSPFNCIGDAFVKPTVRDYTLG